MSDETIEARKARAILYKKIAAVTAAVQRIPKNGKNTFHNYKYATESDLTDGIRDLLNEHGLAFLPPTVLSHERIPIEGSKQGPLTRVQMQFALACCETGETVTGILWADGQDAADKGFYKAYTGGVKYFLMKTFLVATGDDPEQDQPQPPRGAQYQEAPRQPAVQGAQPRPKPNAPAAQQAAPALAPMSEVSRATTVTRIRANMRRSQDFGFNDARKLAVDLEALTDADLMMADKVWKERADTLAAEDARGIAA